eukprot:380740_1
MTQFTPDQSINLSLIENKWFYEKNDAWPGTCNGYSIKTLIALKRSKYQEILIFDSTNGTRVLVLDGVVQFDSLWEHIYHEMMVHSPLFAHPNPKNVLVIGGGDGGCIREIIKHECIQKIIWVEIDKDVIELTKEFCPAIHTENIYKDGRVQLLIEDGLKYVEHCKDNIFDIIIVDSSDPIGASPSACLFTNEFYKHCHRILKDGGIINSQNECLWDESGNDIICKSLKDSRMIYKGGDVRYCSMYTPMYTGGQLGCVVARKYCSFMYNKYKTLDVDRVYREIPYKIQKTLKYYSANMHRASFILPYQTECALSKL